MEELTKAIFRAGFSWRVVREKWDAFRRAIDGFNLDRVAAYEAADIARLFNDSRIVRNRRKITGTVENARRSLAPLIAEHRQTFDRDRRLPEQVFTALAEANLFRLWLPVSEPLGRIG